MHPHTTEDTFMHPRLVQVDVEGWEWSVMKGAAKAMESKLVENIIMEYSPGEGLHDQT